LRRTPAQFTCIPKENPVPLTTLDARTALVVIDLQEGIAAMAGRPSLAAPAAHAGRLAAAFRARTLPVVLVHVAFSPDGGDRPTNRVTWAPSVDNPPANWAGLMPELDRRPADIVVTKRQPGAFYGTDLDLQLRRRRCTGIVLCGVATSLGVESTGRAAYDHGYNVTFASDATTDFNPTAHNHSLDTVFPRIGEVDTTDRIIATVTSS
jgi:nicotinamidase-related amidase